MANTKEDILLRLLTHLPLITKGSEITEAEYDNTLISIYESLVEASVSSYVPAYSAVITYDDTTNNYSVFAGQIWKMINAAPQINITPGTDVSVWVRKYGSDLAHKKDQDQKLDDGGVNEVTAAQIKQLITGRIPKEILINDWDMVTFDTKTVAHGLTATEYKTIRNINVSLRNDTDSIVIPLNRMDDIVSGVMSGSVSTIGATNITLYRMDGGDFDGTNYDSTGFNRGWVNFEYTPD